MNVSSLLNRGILPQKIKVILSHVCGKTQITLGRLNHFGLKCPHFQSHLFVRHTRLPESEILFLGSSLNPSVRCLGGLKQNLPGSRRVPTIKSYAEVASAAASDQTCIHNFVVYPALPYLTGGVSLQCRAGSAEARPPSFFLVGIFMHLRLLKRSLLENKALVYTFLFVK